MSRFAIWIASVFACAVSFPRTSRRNFLRRGAPRVDDSYRRVAVPGDTYHDLKNVLVEWTRADPQLAAKTLAAMAVSGWVAAALLLWLRLL